MTPSGETVRAVQVTRLDGPEHLAVAHPRAPVRGEDHVLIRVHSVGVAFPDLLLSRGQYQLKPELPFTLGTDVAGIVLEGTGPFVPGDRVCASLPYGGAADVIAVPVDSVFPLPARLTFDQGAALPLNYLTAHFALTTRAEVRSGETVLVHGAAGGVGTATIQTALALGARPIAVVSSRAKAEVARSAGARDVVLVDDFKASVLDLTSGVGVDVVVDVVGGDVLTESLRCLAPLGRLLVVGFAGGEGIPTVKVNRLLLRNIDVRGVGWGAFARRRPGFLQQQWAALTTMVDAGSIRPVLGPVRAPDDYGDALSDMAQRVTTGKAIVRMRD